MQPPGEPPPPWLLSNIAMAIWRPDVARSASGSRFSARTPLSASHPLTRPITAWFKPVKPNAVFSTAALIIASSAGTKTVAWRQSTADKFAWTAKGKACVSQRSATEGMGRRGLGLASAANRIGGGSGVENACAAVAMRR